MAEKKPAFEGKLVYVATDGRWIAGVPSRDITAEEWVENGYSDRANFTPEDLVKTGLYELKPPRAKPGMATAKGKANDKAGADSKDDSTSDKDTDKK